MNLVISEELGEQILQAFLHHLGRDDVQAIRDPAMQRIEVRYRYPNLDPQKVYLALRIFLVNGYTDVLEFNSESYPEYSETGTMPGPVNANNWPNLTQTWAQIFNRSITNRPQGFFIHATSKRRMRFFSSFCLLDRPTMIEWASRIFVTLCGSEEDLDKETIRLLAGIMRAKGISRKEIAELYERVSQNVKAAKELL